MITFVVAIYPEARPLIERFRLKKQKRTIPFEVFSNEEQGIRLLLTGTGAVEAAIAVSSLLSVSDTANEILINLGTSAISSKGESEEGAFFLCAKLIEQTTGRTFYPDLLYRHPKAEIPFAQLVTVPCVITQKNAEQIETKMQGFDKQPMPTLYDMEATAIYQAAIHFLAPHQIMFFKVVSDTMRGERVTPAFVEQCMTRMCEVLFGAEGVLESFRSFAGSDKDLFEEYLSHRELERLAADFKCSETMKYELATKIRYAFLEGRDPLALFARYYENGMLPVQNKKTGKKRLEELGESLIQTDPALPTVTKDRNIGAGVRKSVFSVIYVEEQILTEKKTQEILSHFPKAKVILIHHYKDVFSRKRQSIALQDQSKALILAKKTGNLIYEGAKVCQSFGNENFYYTSCVMNCIYDCAYCYLKGMYPSGNMVIFVNLEDIFLELTELLSRQSVYLCVSYDTDLLAIEQLTGYVRQWIDFTKKHPNLRIEIRTKCARTDLWDTLPVTEQVVFAFTLSPASVAEHYEHGAATLQARLDSLIQAYEHGFTVRLCFDPMIYCPDWREEYTQLFEQVARKVDFDRIMDVSIGSFRISEEYLKKMRKAYPNEAVVQYPYTNHEGVCRYDDVLLEEMEQLLQEKLLCKMPSEKIFRWGENEQKSSKKQKQRG